MTKDEENKRIVEASITLMYWLVIFGLGFLMGFLIWGFK